MQPVKRPVLKSLLSCLLFVASIQASLFAEMASSVKRFGVTWTFDKAYEVGTFANGDWWVLGPVTITEISPASVDDKNGNMINPPLNKNLSFDRRMQRNSFDAEANVATQLPLTVDKPASILSAISLEADTTKDNPQLDTIAILTVLMEKPAEGSFRPPYQGDDKTILGNKADLNYEILRKLEPVEGAPEDLVALAEKFDRPYIELKLGWTGRYTHPKSNQPAYGRELAHRLGYGLLALQLDVPDEQKEALFINLVQIGIDIYGAARLGGKWNADGGHNQGRKMPMLLAGLALNNQEILKYANAEEFMIFQEDQQTFYVEQKHIDTPRREIRGRPLHAYTPDMLGKPEWGIRNYHEPDRSGSNWGAYYRTVSGAPTITHVLVAHLMGVEEIWNHPPLFDYYDRYFEVESEPEVRKGKGTNGIQTFTLNMWNAYR
ncbi:hypothetical protein P0Y35_09135 [Kiritimatiellaeota bacterium B1221]|nr:hypothetical protein [Kiritimatiellaeota bacterium B1221]